MARVTCTGVVFCLVLSLLAGLAEAGQPKKRDLEARIARLEELLQSERPILPVLPRSPGEDPTCLVGTVLLCHHADGTITRFCSDPIGTCSGEPSPEVCPELCEAQGDVVVVDYDKDACDAAAEGKPYAFVCMSPDEYAARPGCPASFVLHYRSESANGWVCEPSFGNEHLSRSVFDALLFERARTNFLIEEIANQCGDPFDPATPDD